MTSAGYREGIESTYAGEVIAERLYRELAGSCEGGRHRTQLEAIADIEQLTHRRLQPIVDRLGIVLDESECRSILDRRLQMRTGLAWRDLIEAAARDWPPYIERFEALKSLAPAGDLPMLQLLVDHEVALVEFVRLERAQLGSAASIKTLEAFLRRWPLQRTPVG